MAPGASAGCFDHAKIMRRQRRVLALEDLEDARARCARKPVTAPTRISGAVSPNARAIARMTPVSTPGAAYGSTWLRTTSHRVAPTP